MMDGFKYIPWIVVAFALAILFNQQDYNVLTFVARTAGFFLIGWMLGSIAGESRDRYERRQYMKRRGYDT